MLDELKATLSIILVSCMISILYEYVVAALAVAHSKSYAGNCKREQWVIVTDAEEILTLVSARHLEKDNCDWKVPWLIRYTCGNKVGKI